MAELTANELDAYLALEALHEGYKTMAYGVELNAIASSVPTSIGDTSNYTYTWVDRNTFQGVSPPWLHMGLLTETQVNSILIELEDGAYNGRIVYSFPDVPLTPLFIPQVPTNDFLADDDSNNIEPTNPSNGSDPDVETPVNNSPPDNTTNESDINSQTPVNNTPPDSLSNQSGFSPEISENSNELLNLATPNFGTSGNDNLTGDFGNDILNGRDGDDAIWGAGGEDRLFGNTGNDGVFGGDQADLINGNQGNDISNGNQGDDTVRGGKGDDWVWGGKNNDLVYGDLGNDEVYGDLGNDTLTGGDGNDTLTGGEGENSFVFNGNAAFSADMGVDLLSDFTSQKDKIVIHKDTFTALVNPLNGLLPLDSFAVVSSDEIAGTSSGLIVYNSTTGGLFYNQNGVEAGFGTGGQFATLLGNPVLTAGDFLVQP